jgi:hypothetical protein
MHYHYKYDNKYISFILLKLPFVLSSCQSPAEIM